ncbi:MAG TPA: hypothetical protein VHT00_17185, partial [Stellaceae bacterium]|nr:hypothetical protein [Stellaceae bacterium]
GLRALPVVNPQKGVVSKGETDAGGSELAGQPAMPIAIELQTERAPGLRIPVIMIGHSGRR